MKRLLAIDPGISGAACLFVCGSLVPIEPGGLIDLPTVGDAKQREIDVLAFRDWMLQMEPDECIIEQVQAMPSIPGPDGVRRSMGAASSFNFGGAYRVLKAIPMLFNIPTRPVTPQRWRKLYGLKGGEGSKETSRQLALQKWPCLSSYLNRKMDHQRAEAVLIANYLWKTETGQVEPKLVDEDKIRPISSMLEISRRLDDVDDIPE